MLPAMRTLALVSLALSLAPWAACGNDVASEEDARAAYLGLDPHVDKAITLGFAGFNAASSANISPQMVNGALSGTLTVTGQVDQGASANKGMRLQEAMVMYSDVKDFVYVTGATAPALEMMLKNIPTGTLTGTLNGTYAMTGSLEGDVTLTLNFSGELQAGAGMNVERKPGTTHITGTASSRYGDYTVDVTR
jgi:hypothetical protein